MDKPQQTVADYVAIAICPLLIMALVGSLVFFLLEIVYVGQYAGSLQYILFFFVFGAVLVSRISMGESAQRAPLYGLVLGLVTWIALLKFVECPEESALAPWAWAINLGLIAVIWWSAHKLTWDCTLIDDEVDASGAGLLEVTGLERQSAGARERESAERAPALPRSGAPQTWLERYARYREERKKQPHAPGVWVVYFSLAALPLFGLGQSQIPPEEPSRRSYAFQLMVIYVGSGLGLLLGTSFLGLRRYLRQRKLRMPAGITIGWLTLGAFLILLVLGFGAILPQPGATHPLLEWTGIGSRDRKTSPLAQVGGGNKPTKDNQGAKIKGKDKDSEEKGQGPEKKGASGSTNKDKQPGDKKDQAESKGKDKEPDGKDTRGKEGKEDKEKGSGGKRQDKDKKEDKANSKRETAQTPPSSSVGSFFKNLAGILKWVVFGILAVLIVFVLLRSGLRWLANFTLWAQRLLAALSAWWQSLGRLFKRTGTAEETIPKEMPMPPRPFSAYPDPFLYGEGETMPVAKLVRYSFEALEAWARERDRPRNLHETALEFAAHLGGEIPELDRDVRRLAGYYAGLAYAGKAPGASCREAVRVFWQRLAEVIEEPASEASA